MTARMKLLLSILGVLVTALAINQLVLQSKNPMDTSGNPTVPTNTIAVPNNPAPSNRPLLPSITKFNPIWQRNLFAPDRKPPSQTLAPRNTLSSQTSPNANNDQPPEFTITGVAIRPNGGSVLIKKNRREVVRALVGDEVDGWLIEELTPDSVTLSKGGNRWKLPIGIEQ